MVAQLRRTPLLAKFAEWGFSEVRYTLATPRNTKDTLFGGCGRTHDLGTVLHKSGQRLRIASRRTWAPKERGAGSQWCNRLPRLFPKKIGEKGVVLGICVFRLLADTSALELALTYEREDA